MVNNYLASPSGPLAPPQARAQHKRAVSNAATLSTTGGTPQSPSLLSHEFQAIDALQLELQAFRATVMSNANSSTSSQTSSKPPRIKRPASAASLQQPRTTSGTVITGRSTEMTSSATEDLAFDMGGDIIIPSPNDARAHYQSMDKRYSSSFDALEIKDSGMLNQCALSWQNVSFSVRRKQTRSGGGLCRRSNVPANARPRPGELDDDDGKHCILKSISGRSGPGDLTAIIGPSGAGKTTLLDLLAERINSSSGDVGGIVEVNGRPREKKSFRSVMNYVSQDMAFLGSFTVLETLQ
ncbi:hypothetical protein Gpo141_00013113, partial [Globisporangium polare]